MQLIRAIELRGINYRASSKPNELWLCCPFCGDMRYRLGLNTLNLKAHCFNCNFSGEGQRTVDAFQQLWGGQIEYDAEFDSATAKPVKQKRIKLPEDFIPLKPSGLKGDEYAQECYDYLRERGLTDGQILQHRIGFALSGRFSYRALFPVLSTRGKVMGLVARDYTGVQNPPYLNETGMKRCPFNAEVLARHRSNRMLVLCEGVFDALSVERAGFTAIAMLGRVMTDFQLNMLRKFDNLVMFLDMDVDGVASGLQNCAALVRPNRTLCVAHPRLSGGKDAGALRTAEVREAIAEAQPYTAVLGMRIRARLQAHTLFANG